jgi:uncharacterized protein YkwD
MPFNWIDLVLALIIVGSAAAGWHRGFIRSMLDLTRWLGSWLAALLLYRPVSAVLGYMTAMDETWRSPVAFLVVLVITSLVVQLTGQRLLRRIPDDLHDDPINRVSGAFPGLVNGTVIAAIMSALLFSFPVSDKLSHNVQDSVLADRFAVYTGMVEDVLVPIFGPALRQTLNRLTTIEPGSDELVELPFKVENSKPAPAVEAQMLELVNRERIANGLKPLVDDPELTEVARAHATDMFVRGYFSHYTPEGRDPFERMKAAKVRFKAAGENLALAPTLQIAHTGLMNSPGHRANILSDQFGRVGIGIMNGGRRGLMIAQEFRD